MHVSNVFYYFLSDVSLDSRALKISENFRRDHRIDFQNTFYIKHINISISPSIILRSLV